MNAQIVVALQEAGNAVTLLARLLIAGDRMGSGEHGQAAELLERAAHRVRAAGNGMIPPQAVVAEDAAE